MQIPAKAHYAAIAMLALAAKHATGELVSARTIAHDHGVPSQFLVQIMQLLRSAGLIASLRGSSGGFRLQRAPELISLAEVVDAVCASQATVPTERTASNLNLIMTSVWNELVMHQRTIMEEMSLQDLLNREANVADAMYYI
jgi:Rrf2 family protein